MYLVGNNWANCLKTHKKLTMCLPGKTPSAPSERRLAELVIRNAEQSDTIDLLKVQVESMVGQLCQCNKENEEVPSVLDEPIVLHRQGDGPAPIGPSPPLSGSSSVSSSSSGLNTLVENGGPIPIIYPSLELIQVRRQRARRALGSLTSCYSPYSSDTESRKSPHQLSSVNHGAEVVDRIGDE